MGSAFLTLTAVLTGLVAGSLAATIMPLGRIMVYCRKRKLLRWLVWNVWGNEDWYLDQIEAGMGGTNG